MPNNDELRHYDVLGMRWGVRRYGSGGKVGKLSAKREKYLAKSDKYHEKAKKTGSKYVTEIGRGLTESRYKKAVKYDRKVRKLDKKISKLTKNESLYDYIDRTKKYKDLGYNYTLKHLNESSSSFKSE